MATFQQAMTDYRKQYPNRDPLSEKDALHFVEWLKARNNIKIKITRKRAEYLEQGETWSYSDIVCPECGGQTATARELVCCQICDWKNYEITNNDNYYAPNEGKNGFDDDYIYNDGY